MSAALAFAAWNPMIVPDDLRERLAEYGYLAVWYGLGGLGGAAAWHRRAEHRSIAADWRSERDELSSITSEIEEECWQSACDQAAEVLAHARATVRPLIASDAPPQRIEMAVRAAIARHEIVSSPRAMLAEGTLLRWPLAIYLAADAARGARSRPVRRARR